MKKTLLAIFVIFSSYVYSQHNIIPAPVEYKSTNSTMVLTDNLRFNFSFDNEKVRQYANDFRLYLKNYGLNVADKQNEDTKQMKIALCKPYNKELAKEGYLLKVNEHSIDIEANTEAGVFYAFQTLRQLLPISAYKLANKEVKIPTCVIKDYPRFEWRGLMLDVSRHFFSVDEVKAYIDKMSEYKFNVLHWHLTDDEGWRIEIKSLPKLTEVGAWRVKRYGRFGVTRKVPQANEATDDGGFYTQKEVKDIIEYAQNKNITIVPEIDMPGHCMALLAAYPELSTRKEKKYVNPGAKFSEWYSGGRFEMLIENTLNPSDEKVYEFADKVFKEIAELFPAPYIHTGGDECYHGYWDKSKDVQKFMKKNKIANGHELQSYFVGRIAKIIKKYDKIMVGWDEILDGKLNKNTVVMSWRGMKHGIKAAGKGYKVVMSPTTYAYLDYTQGDHSLENPIYADLKLEKTYKFEPVPENIDPQFILGAQANLWTEAVPTMQFAFYMTYPRAFAISETAWSKPQSKNWNNFIKRTENHFEYFDKSNTNICKAVYEPTVKVYKQDGKLMCSLTNSIPDAEIYYSIDNTYPVKFAVKYEKAFEIPQGRLNLRTQCYRNGKALGREIILSRKDLELRVKN